MKPQLGLTVIPDQNSDYATVCLTATMQNDAGIDHDVVLYHTVRLVQGLGEDMSIDAWALAAFADHARAIELAIAQRIAHGEMVLTLNSLKQQEPLF